MKLKLMVLATFVASCSPHTSRFDALIRSNTVTLSQDEFVKAPQPAVPFADTNIGFLVSQGWITSEQPSTVTAFRCYETPERMLVVQKSTQGGVWHTIFSTNMNAAVEP